MKNVDDLDARTRAERCKERRARYRKWQLLICAVLVALLSGIGAYAGIVTRGDDGSKASYPVAKAGEGRSSSVAPDEVQESTAGDEV